MTRVLVKMAINIFLMEKDKVKDNEYIFLKQVYDSAVNLDQQEKKNMRRILDLYVEYGKTALFLAHERLDLTIIHLIQNKMDRMNKERSYRISQEQKNIDMPIFHEICLIHKSKYPYTYKS